MVTAEEALASEDPSVVRRLRGSINTQITCDVNLLEKELSKKLNGEIDLDSISHQLIRIQKRKLNEHFELFHKLHDRYILIREEGDTEAEEESLVQADVDYLEKITIKVCPILDKISHYEEALAEKNQIKTLSKEYDNTLETVEKSRKEFNLVYNKIKLELDRVDSIDVDEEKLTTISSLPIDTMARNISTAFNDLKRNLN